MKQVYYFSIALCISACTNSQPNSEKKDSNKVETVITKSDSLSVDLVSLKNKGLLNNTQIITIKNDPVYHKSKRFNALVLKDVLEKYSALRTINVQITKIVFECEDGYKPEMSLQKLLSAKAFLAISDVDAPKGHDWEQIMKDEHKMNAAPFYVVYQDVSEKW